MTISRLRLIAAAALGLAALGGPARAQYGYPGGYGNYGWGGWGGGGSTVGGSYARGMGAFAAGAGYYNNQTAQANSINADTVMRFNEYLYQSQQVANKRYHETLVKQDKNNIKSRQQIYDRLRNNPNRYDINNGDALNVALDEVTAPKVAFSMLEAAKLKIPGTMIRDIPFNYAAKAITGSVEQLTHGGPPASLQTPAFDADRATLKAVAAEIKASEDEQGQFDATLLKKAEGQLQALRTKIEAKIPAGTGARQEAENYVKGLLGFVRMMQTPAINVLLAGVDKRPEVTLGDLLGFMVSFNLRFGPAKSEPQVAAYTQIYPLLVSMRTEIGGPTANAPDASMAQSHDPRPSEFFSGMPIDQLSKKVPPLTPPAPMP